MWKNKKSVFIILILFLLIVIMVFSPTIIAQFNKYLLDRNKEVVTETKIVTTEEFLTITYEQMKLAQQLESSKKYSMVAEEVRDGYDKTSKTYYFLDTHPEIEKVKIELSITKYHNNGETIKFINDKGHIIEVYSKDEWKIYKESQ
ncbi:hypothetical protein [Caldalkalibacillus salinus]|uniref:hypothetical protein n=1 Tax=Caldalkalibacillus salinus TaxID=2803787 RepID=UPI001924FE36|nr:hypothetical protein [Caldalkalibacillus salinus]